ncbi:MAG: amidohydrolase [Planctomycetota bacterium]|nr:MAG: amidohydrolase [Planctomycetota bacterium]
MNARRFLPLLALALAPACQVDATKGEATRPAPPAAETVFTGGHFVTLDEALPEAQAIAVSGGRIVAVGSAAEIAAYIGPETEELDLAGAFAMPGFIEGHGHFTGIGDAKMQLDLMHARTWNEIVQMVATAVAEAAPGELIRGRGWHQEKWDVTPEPSYDGLPVHDGLSAVSPDNPVILRHASGHASFGNAKAMELADITIDTVDPDGGEIVRDREGHPIGMFRETAQALLSRASRGARATDFRQLVELADREVTSKGITSFQDAGSSFATVARFRELVDEGAIDVRLWVMIRDGNDRLADRLAETRVVGYGDDHLTVRAIKHSIDGALGSHGAWLLEPYADLDESTPNPTGQNTTPVDTIEATAQLALEHGFQLCVHAIGDRANRETLDIFERSFAGREDGQDLRWRVEHAQHISPADIPRFAELGVIASMQGVHCTSDGPWIEPRLGARRALEGAYVWRSLMDSGAVVTNGTDAPVEDVDPIASFYATVTRQLADGTRFYPDQRMSRLEALRSYTLACAYAAFEEDVKGSLVPGKLADITVLSKDILTCPEDEIRNAEVLYTIIGGKVVYRNDSALGMR